MCGDVLSDAIARFRAGDGEALATLHAQLQPAIRSVLARYRRGGGLPSSIDFEDLRQHTWIILAELALRWQPSGSFLRYFLASFPRELRRYVVHSRLNRGSRTQVMSLAPADLVRLADDARDGGGESEAFLWAEQLGALPSRERVAFVLRAFDGLDFTAIAIRLGASRASAHRLYRRACARLISDGGDGGLVAAPKPGTTGRSTKRRHAGCEAEVDIPGIVRLLHRLAGPRGVLPGRRRLIGPARLQRRALTAVLERLQEAGVISQRGRGRAGRLVEPTLEASLRRIDRLKSSL